MQKAPNILPNRAAKAAKSARLRAFTIIEMIVVMMLSTLVFSMALIAFQISAALYENYQQQSEESIELDHCRALLALDIAKASALYFDNNELQCVYPRHRVHYQLAGSSIVRWVDPDAPKPDTLLQAESSAQAYFETEAVYSGPIDQLEIKLLYWNQTFQFHYKKPIDAAYHLNQSDRYEY